MLTAQEVDRLIAMQLDELNFVEFKRSQVREMIISETS